jgi:hypothetical protein
MNKFAKVKKRELNTHASIQEKRNRGGRPKKAPEEKRSEKIFVNLTKSEKEKLERLAQEEEMALGVFVRKILKKHGCI